MFFVIFGANSSFVIAFTTAFVGNAFVDYLFLNVFVVIIVNVCNLYFVFMLCYFLLILMVMIFFCKYFKIFNSFVCTRAFNSLNLNFMFLFLFLFVFIVFVVLVYVMFVIIFCN